ncbi:uncharacterized protein B0I36DRAFT_357707 [Microdochium trichocladiopsis]|uniref:Uncharacterized protein n=1 Tax=Microdochium trichocladiopsis TaxID=1682393 RepID=A0A9P8YHJ5_9PEZI|nr:uncharacterized protein B0I36DRAFT_357707 [Microdochium trichocladiopsis]KAH7040400.1 hypothetical protein B0I36DRAFT_357707 [Microdochium trichocladiopsis]
MAFQRTASPVLTMPSGVAHQPFGAANFGHQTTLFNNLASGSGMQPGFAQMQMASTTRTSRKRSRDEAGVNLDVAEAKLSTVEPVKESEDGWVFGPGMTLIKKSSYVSEASSQSGTWLEEKAAAEKARKDEEARAVDQQTRPSLRTNKSQRLDMTAVSIPENGSRSNRSSPVRDAEALSSAASSQPSIDNFTLHLGIGWSRLSQDEHIQAAARGWARYIENHFPVTNVQIQLESRGLQSYLVEATEGYFLFAENLQQGQFVSKDLNRTFENLRSNPPVFEGAAPMSAAVSPSPVGPTIPQQAVNVESLAHRPAPMVSQPDRDKNSPPSSSLTVRGAQSVVSARTSTSRPYASSRSKRYNRSHAGGTSYVPQNEFPIFNHSGDVEIFIKAGHVENRYLLHRHTLTRCSGFFEASTSRQWSKAAVVPALPEPPTRDLARIGEDSRGGSSTEGSVVGSTNNNELARTTNSDSQSSEPRRRWRYELDPGTGRDDIPMLIQKDAEPAPQATTNPSTATGSLFGGGSGRTANTPVVRNRPSGHQHTHSNGSFFRSVANLSLVPTRTEPETPLSQAEIDLLRDYDNLFRVFYNYPPILDGINIADAYVQCKSLLTLADQYDALAVTGPRVDHHLLQFQTRLWKQIAKYPVSYLRLGYLARSKIIFQEALIHVVGQWPAGERSIRHALPDSVLDIIEDKVDELEETVSRIEGRLFRLTLTNSRGEKTSPGTSFLDWLAVSFFRQWLADNTSGTSIPQEPPSNSDRHRPRDRTSAAVQAAATLPSLASIGRTYRTLGSPSGSGFLDHDECKRFLKLSPELYSRDNLRRFEKRIDELKAAAREIVRPLMGTGLELEMDRESNAPSPDGRPALAAPPVNSMTSYLTCIRVHERDLPWDAE